MTRAANPDENSGSPSQIVAHSWRATDRFVPRVVVRPMQSLMAVETSSAVLILGATVAALMVANTPMVEAYEHFWETTLALEVGDLHVLHITLHELVNDAL